MKSSKKELNRWFGAVLYREDENFQKYFNNIINNFNKVTWIEHNRDINEEGETKKAHIHIMFNIGENARHKNSIAKIIDITPNYLEGINQKAYLQYLIHLNNPEKTQYSINEVEGELKEKLKEIIDKTRDSKEQILDIIEAIDNKEIYNIKSLMIYGCNKNVINTIKTSQYLFIRLIEEKRQEELLTKKQNKNKLLM